VVVHGSHHVILVRPCRSCRIHSLVNVTLIQLFKQTYRKILSYCFCKETLFHSILCYSHQITWRTKMRKKYCVPISLAYIHNHTDVNYSVCACLYYDIMLFGTCAPTLRRNLLCRYSNLKTEAASFCSKDLNPGHCVLRP